MTVTIDRPSCVICKTFWETCPAVSEQNSDNRFRLTVETYWLNGIKKAGILPPERELCIPGEIDLTSPRIIPVERGQGDFR